MTLLTLISAPKPFVDQRIAVIQENALGSWSRLHDVEIFLMGDGSGLRDASRAHGAAHFPDVRTNEKGTPLISSMLELARQRASGELLGIVNADMILMEDLLLAIRIIRSNIKGFLALGRRWDLDVSEPLDFTDAWETRLRQGVRATGRLHRPSGSDVFVFPRLPNFAVPDFAVGRAGWDNWMIFDARRRGIPV
ncbi:MAG TPA: hypothetical protein VFH29_06775, partial [Anaerolineales bacterium]|nr:hypothetical protein [Anaerolineales bacterium]